MQQYLDSLYIHCFAESCDEKWETRGGRVQHSLVRDYSCYQFLNITLAELQPEGDMCLLSGRCCTGRAGVGGGGEIDKMGLNMSLGAAAAQHTSMGGRGGCSFERVPT